MIFLQKKINIKLKYFLGKFVNSGESNSCPGSPVKGQNYWGSGRNPEHLHVWTLKTNYFLPAQLSMIGETMHFGGKMIRYRMISLQIWCLLSRR